VYNDVELDVSGAVVPSAYLPGQVISMIILPNTSINQLVEKITSGNTELAIASYVYTPKYTYSTIIVEYSTTYTVEGASSIDINNNVIDDEFRSNININGNDYCGAGLQHWNYGTGAGTRSGTLFPLTGAYNYTYNPDPNADNTIPIVVSAHRTAGDDKLHVYTLGTWMKITEVGR
jgi:hypothetical protein